MDYDVAVVGGGAVGSNVARRLAEDVDVAVLEKELDLVRHQSGRNSGVLHPGFNYEPGSTKAEYAVEGTKRTKEFCRDHDVPVDECGVFVAAQSVEERKRLERLAGHARENDVEARVIEGDEMRETEPHASGVAALHAPEAASVDSMKYVQAVADEARDRGADYHTNTKVESVDDGEDRRHRVVTDKGDFEVDYVVNCAGLQADRVASEFDVGDGYRVVPFRGEYYELATGARRLCSSMIYPVPDPDLPFLGVHFTRRTDGKVIVGPNAVLALAREGYSSGFNFRDLASTLSYPGFWKLVGSKKMMSIALKELHRSYRKSRFVEDARKLVPDAEPEDFRRSFSGVRAQVVSTDGDLVQDPVLEHGDASTHVLNAVSPGLTCSLPYGEHVAEETLERL